MNKIFVLGLTPQGLSVLRVLSRSGVPVIAFCSSARNVGYHSRYGEKILFDDIKDLKSKIAEKLKVLDYKPVCYITSGEILAAVLRDFPEIYTLCNVISGPYETIAKLAHKDIMYGIAKSKGFKVAKYATLDKYKEGELKFPLFMKRNYEISLFFKAAYIPDKKVLNEYLERIEPSQKKDIIIQEYIPIPKNRLKEISVQTFFSNSEAKGFLFGDQVERLSKGLTAFLVEIDNDSICQHIKHLCCLFMQDLNYTGFAEFEFMYDVETKDLYFVEVNTRTCGLQSSLNYKFSNLADLLKNPLQAPMLSETKKTVKWINVQRYLRCKWQKKNLSGLSNLFNSSYDILDWKDLKPFFRQLI